MSDNHIEEATQEVVTNESDPVKENEVGDLVTIDSDVSSNDQHAVLDTGQDTSSAANVGHCDEAGSDNIENAALCENAIDGDTQSSDMGDHNESRDDVINEESGDVIETDSDVTNSLTDASNISTNDVTTNVTDSAENKTNTTDTEHVFVESNESVDIPKNSNKAVNGGMSNKDEEEKQICTTAISDSNELCSGVNECSINDSEPKAATSNSELDCESSQDQSHSSVQETDTSDSNSHSSTPVDTPSISSSNDIDQSGNDLVEQMVSNQSKVEEHELNLSPSTHLQSDTDTSDKSASSSKEHNSNCDNTESTETSTDTSTRNSTENIQSVVLDDKSSVHVSNDLNGDSDDDLLSQLESELRTEIPESTEKKEECSASVSNDVNEVQETAISAKTDTLNSETHKTDNAASDTTQSDCAVLETVDNTPKDSLKEEASLVQSTGQGDLVHPGNVSQPQSSHSDFKELQSKYDTLQKLYADKDIVIKRLHGEKELITKSLQNALNEKDSMNERIKEIAEKSSSGQKAYIATIKELENTIAQQKQEVESTQEKLKSHDIAAKRAIQQLQTELQGKLAHITRAFEECRREKEGMVVKYAMAEQKNIDMENRMQKNNKRCMEMEKETNLAVNKFKTIRAEKTKMDEIFQLRNSEIMSLRRELEKFKELKSEQELKTKWHQNKLKTELESHKETKGKLDEANKKLKQARDEAENMKRDCQAMIKQYHDTEEQKSSSLAAKVDEKEAEVNRRKQEVVEQQEVHSLVKNQLETLKRNHKDMIEELRTAKDKITCLEAERLHQEDTLAKFKDTLQQQKNDNKELYDKLAALEDIEHQLSIEKEKVSSMQRRVSELEELNSDLRSDIESCANREGGHLDITKRLSDANARLQSENSGLVVRVEALETKHGELQGKYGGVSETAETLEKELAEEKQRRIEEVGSLTVKVEEKSKAAEELAQMLEDQKDENKTLKRRHASNVKDLHRQLQQAHRKLEKGSLNGEVSSMGSRTSSNNSLNTLVNNDGGPAAIMGPMATSSSSMTIQEETPLPQESEPPLVQFVEVDKQVLVEKIVKLQKSLARRNEKLEFQEEHINQLVSQLQKKAKVIQSYVMREEAGALAPESSDLNKVQLARKGGIMASMYNHHSRDGHMTMDLSLQINDKLQSVLEDTLLKNITLKESMDTLGREISDLSQQNRELQLSLQKTGRKS